MLNLTAVDIRKNKVEALIIPVCEDTDIYEQTVLNDLAKAAKRFAGFDGQVKQELTLFEPLGVKAERVVFLGLGKGDKLTAELLRQCAGAAAKRGRSQKLATMIIAAPSAKHVAVDLETAVTAILEGAYLGNHVFDMYKSKKETKPLKRADVLVPPGAANGLKHLPKQIETVCAGTLLARNWVSTPSNDKPPARFAQSVARLARKEKLKVTIKTEKQLADLGFGALMAVAAGSKNPPRLLILEYRPKTFSKTIVLVGKGVTFDSGGINLKPSGGLEEMKMDMAGAAAVAATMITVAKQKPRYRIFGAMPLVENMPSGTATRPGDIITTYSGKTVEIGNTDAEGRLILADTIAYMLKTCKPDIVLDLATLTGACIVALGEKIAGTFSRDDQLAESIVTAGAKTHERCWRLPLPDDYKEMLKSEVADINNMANARWGGAITAALFLSEFVNETRWAHIDIAGPAYSKKANAYCGAGGTGFGVRLLCRLIDDLAAGS